MIRIIAACLFMLLSGCQHALLKNSSGFADEPVTATLPWNMNIESLIDFSSQFQALDPQAQLVLCTQMRKSIDREADLLTGWYLATAITLTPRCGETEEAVELIGHILKRRFVNSEVTWLASYQLDLLRREQHQQQQLKRAIAGQQELQRKLTQSDKTNSALETKLRDLKRIETSIIQRLDEKQ